ncbi:hypothetical protein SBC1_43760 (plasmid) [Caballeronia sp. SBC1]|uniref:hypothetical protein n=1 Tax=Caballeronia sp. SBC2 TaxID=2705547 RepID=UPI0013E18DD9|nr:hypothetical protein [Caballeronia sp. SBC2]QIE26347.1 hypothetical protein SBC2_44170 [Caballeronia sp. SBC2]QIN64336.1 hypothetical protein SBC1_43760 [Caballeronia sp. SBC1]
MNLKKMPEEKALSRRQFLTTFRSPMTFPDATAFLIATGAKNRRLAMTVFRLRREFGTAAYWHTKAKAVHAS